MSDLWRAGGAKKKLWAAAILAAAFLLGAGAEYAISAGKDAIKPFVVRENSGGYKFINPILVFTIGDKENFPQYAPLEKTLTDYIQNTKAAGKATDVSVYFRNLKNETWTGINEEDKYAPSSMLKVAVLIAYLKLSESDPSLLSKKAFYEEKIDPGQYFKPKHPLATGWHSNEELIKNMIDESDNVSVLTLIDNEKDGVAKVYHDLELPTPKSPTDIDFMSARLYSRLFRVLYNGTYLSKDLSERALSILSGTDFDKGIKGAIPASIVVAHKFGERTLYNTTDGRLLERQLHDCGIIYKPENPYFLCVMTRGKNFDALESVISGISDLVYKNVSLKL
ncbi:class A beta-lactamase-related serine hydrolase [Candidatus Parcubacteria bacterium]|nr:class A beta-lactamase-related serine hydrolase [Candidatus Parcubacteria bacterium]